MVFLVKSSLVYKYEDIYKTEGVSPATIHHQFCFQIGTWRIAIALAASKRTLTIKDKLQEENFIK